MDVDVDPILIANKTLLCLQRFKEVYVSSKSWSSATEYDPSPSDIEDSWGRFRIWTDNIGALQQQRSRSSLDHRLRHSDVRDEILRLLAQLLSALNDMLEILRNVREQRVWHSGATESFDSSDDAEDASFMSDSDSTTTNESHGHEAQTPSEPETSTELGELYSITVNAISSLFRLSLLIQKSSRGIKFAKSSREGEYDTQHDSLYIQDRFPYISSNRPLVERLGKANARRRQWLSYRKRHRDKLAEANPIENISTGHPSGGSNFPLEEREGWPYAAISSLGSSAARQSRLSSTTATSVQDSQLPKIEEEYQVAASETTSYIDGTQSSLFEEGKLFVPQAPLEVETGQPFECPYCFSIVTVRGLRAWSKHVHADLASYCCTFNNCNEELFESRRDWFNHEMEVHRQEWLCSFCMSYHVDAKEFASHMTEFHKSAFTRTQLPGVVEKAARPLRRIPASACPLCDFEEEVRGRSIAVLPNEAITVRPGVFRRHLGQHLEQVALFVLPKDATMGGLEDLEAGVEEEGEIANSEAFSDRELDSVGDYADEADESGDDVDNESPENLQTAPDLALGWLPPQNFTPPTADFEHDDPDMVPRREDSLFGGDVFTPGWVRGYGLKREGFCGRCVPGVWHNLADKSYERNLTYMHGIPSNGVPLPRPSVIRRVEDAPQKWEGYCDKCLTWRRLKRTSVGWNWFRHCLKEHAETEAADKELPPSAMLQIELEELIGLIRRIDHDQCATILRNKPNLAIVHTPRRRIALHFAADVGDTEILKQLLTCLEQDKHAKSLGGRSAVVNSVSDESETPLTIAASQGHEAVVRLLLENGADVDLCAENGNTALDCAADAGYVSVTKLLLDFGADPNKARLYNALKSARKRSRQSERSMSAAGIPAEVVQAAKRQDLSPLLIAASIGDTDVVKKLIDNGSYLEDVNNDGHTPLMLAGLRGHIHVMEALLDAGANIDATTSKGWTALMLATKEHKGRVVDFLLSRGADVNHISPDHWTALAEATHQRQLGILDRLLVCGADTETKSSLDWTPLMHAAYNGDMEATKLLLEAGAVLEVVSLHDETALLLAIAGGHTEIAEVLLDAGCRAEPTWVHAAVGSQAEPEASEIVLGARESQVGWTPVMLACQTGNMRVLKRLLDLGASTLPTSAMGKTALEIASENGFPEIVDLLQGGVAALHL